MRHQAATTCGVLLLALVAGCALDTFPPAIPAVIEVPAPPVWQPPLACYVPLTQVDALSTLALAAVQFPSAEERQRWQVVSQTPPQVCTGKGKKRRCKPQTPVTAVDQANAKALVHPTIANTQLGQSGRIRYPYDPQGDKVYKILTSPSETTWLLIPATLQIASELLLDSKMWEESYSVVGEGATRQHLIAIRPMYTELKTRAVINMKNGAPIQLDIETQERPGMLRVSWVLPEPVAPPPVTPDQLPPVFDDHLAYNRYTVRLESKGGPPAWMPTGIVDDGKNTLILLPAVLEGVRAPVASAIQQNGHAALVQTRLYKRPDKTFSLYMQGLHPAVELRDAAGIIVRAEREVPQAPMAKESSYEPTRQREWNAPDALSTPVPHTGRNSRW